MFYFLITHRSNKTLGIIFSSPKEINLNAEDYEISDRIPG